MITASPRPPVSDRGDGRFGVEAFAPLVEGRDLQIGAEAHAAGVGSKRPVSRLMSVVLPAPFGPTMPTRSPRAILMLKSRTSLRSP